MVASLTTHILILESSSTRFASFILSLVIHFILVISNLNLVAFTTVYLALYVYSSQSARRRGMQISSDFKIAGNQIDQNARKQYEMTAISLLLNLGIATIHLNFLLRKC
jgi:hypothetical protein